MHRPDAGDASPRSGGPAAASRRRIIVGRAAALLDAAGIGAAGWLSTSERDRHGRLRPGEAADAFLAAHITVRRCVATLVGMEPDEVDIEQHCDRCDRAHGKPRVASRDDVFVSWSHAGPFVAAVAASAPVALDIELLTRPRAVPALAFHPNELARLRARDGFEAIRRWSEKECLVKLGLAGVDDFARLDLGDGYPGIAFETIPAPDGAVCVLATPTTP